MLQRGQGVSLWRQIQRQIADDIAAGLYAGGSKLPTEPELATRFGVNRHTLRRAMAALAEDGLVRIEQGRGTYVQENVVDYMIGKRTRFSEIITRQHRHPGGRLLQAQELPASAEVAEALELPVDTPCLCLESLGEVDGQPLSLSVSHFPAARFPDLIAIVAETGSVTKAMEHHGVGRASEIEEQVRQMAIEGMAHRNRSYKRIISASAEQCVEVAGAAFAGIVLWWNERR